MSVKPRLDWASLRGFRGRRSLSSPAEPDRSCTDNIWFTLLTMNTNPIHFDEAYASKTEFGRPLVNSTFTLLVTGQSVTDLSQNVMANLG